jgi:hypothetical protein
MKRKDASGRSYGYAGEAEIPNYLAENRIYTF